MSSNTIISLAMLKVNMDQGNDYLDYLRPFILQVLTDYDSSEPISDDTISRRIGEQFGLEIPRRVIQSVLSRFATIEYIRRVDGIYWITEGLPDPQLGPKRAEALRHINDVVHGLMEFSQAKTGSPIFGEVNAVNAICSFLAEFNISCLSAYLRGSAIPTIKGSHRTDVVLISDFVQDLRLNDPARFESFLILLQGHMLANALMCPDLRNLSNDFQDVTFYLDTPLLIQRMGCEGEAKRSAARELVSLVKKLKGKVAAFSHSRDELQNVLRRSADFLESPHGRGGIVFEARKNGTTKSDLLLLAAMIDEKLNEAGIVLEDTPRYVESFQIDQAVFEQVLENEVKYYYNPRAKDYDVNSVRSIYVIREDNAASNLEGSRAIFVTSNAGFAKAAWDYGQKYESSRDVSSVITDFSLANIAWLKSPMEAPDLPTAQLLAFSYAALQPSSELLTKFLLEIEKLEAEGAINERALQVLRSDSSLVYSELMHLTLGEDAALTVKTPKDVYDRASQEIRKEESERLALEQRAHEETQEALDTEKTRRKQLVSRIRQQSRRNANGWAWVFSGTVIFLLLVGFLRQFLDRPNSPLSWVFAGGLIVYGLLSLGSSVTGANVVNIHACVRNWLLRWYLRKDAERFGIDLKELSVDM